MKFVCHVTFWNHILPPFIVFILFDHNKNSPMAPVKCLRAIFQSYLLFFKYFVCLSVKNWNKKIL